MEQQIELPPTRQQSAVPVLRVLQKGRAVWEQVYDVDGSLWDVREARETKHGFDLLFGFAANSHPPNYHRSGRPRLITTPALAAYFAAHRTDCFANFDLPVSAATVWRVRSGLGYHFTRDRRALWQNRADDLKSLTSHQLAQKYGVDYKAAHEWRLLILGRVALPLDWWKNAETLAMLHGSAADQEIAGKFGITPDHAARLRQQTRLTGTASAKRVPRLPKRRRTPETLGLLRSELTNREVAAKLGVSVGFSELLRRALSLDPELGQEPPPRKRNRNGDFARSQNWWREPAVLAVLRSDLTVKQMGEKLGISDTHACRLRRFDRSLAEELRPAA